MKCDFCLHGHTIISENGRHTICSLSEKKAIDCLTKKNSSFVDAAGVFTTKEREDKE